MEYIPLSIQITTSCICGRARVVGRSGRTKRRQGGDGHARVAGRRGEAARAVEWRGWERTRRGEDGTGTHGWQGGEVRPHGRLSGEVGHARAARRQGEAARVLSNLALKPRQGYIALEAIQNPSHFERQSNHGPHQTTAAQQRVGVSCFEDFRSLAQKIIDKLDEETA